MSKIFGGSKQSSKSVSTSSSSNQAFPILNSQYGAAGADAFNTGSQALKQELSGGFEGYRDKTGFDFFEKLGLNKVGGSFSGRGAFQSGAAMKSLAEYENNLEKASYNDYLDKLLQQAGLGISVGQLLGGSGQVSSSSSNSTSKGKSSPGLGGFIGSIIGAAAGGG